MGDDKFLCEICGKEFFSKRTLYKHTIAEHTPFREDCTCKLCGKQHKAKIPLGKHLAEHNITPREYYVTHILNGITPTCKNPKCTNVPTFVGIGEGFKTYCCKKCVAAHKHDMEIEAGKVKWIRTKREPKRTDFTCKICNIPFSSDRALRSHNTQKHQEFSDEFTCQICGKQHKTHRALGQHIMEHNIPSDEYYIKYKLNGKTPKCKIPECNNTPEYRGIGEGFLQYCCRECKVKGQKSGSKKSKLPVKETFPEFTCKICGKEGSSLVSLTHHIAGTHKITTEEYYLKHIQERPKCACKSCNNLTRFVNMSHGYSKYCSNECQHKHEEDIGVHEEIRARGVENMQKTFMEKYGVDNAYKVPELKERMIKQVKETKLERYGDENYTNVEKIQKTKEENNLKDPLRQNKINEKTKTTVNGRYGYDNVAKSPLIKQKVSETHNIKYGCHSSSLDHVKEKKDNTNLIKYGVKHPMQNPEIFSKFENSCFRRKPYTLPSGKIVKLQGYEPQCLDIILKYIKEDDIVFKKRIEYVQDDKTRTYHPDFYIKSLNLIVEAKSMWTVKRQSVDNVAAKEFACRSQGYNYVMVLENQYVELLQILGQINPS